MLSWLQAPGHQNCSDPLESTCRWKQAFICYFEMLSMSSAEALCSAKREGEWEPCNSYPLHLKVLWRPIILKLFQLTNVSVSVREVFLMQSVLLLCVDSLKHLYSSVFILSRLDYCNAILSGCHKQHPLEKLQKVENVAAWLLLKACKWGHVSCPSSCAFLTRVILKGPTLEIFVFHVYACMP